MHQLSKEKTFALEEVTERIMRQTMEAMIYEGIINVEKNEREWSFLGKEAVGEDVCYSCTAEEKWSFGRVKIEKGSIKRAGERCTDLYLFLEEVILNGLEGKLTGHFVEELLETLAKDTHSKQYQFDQIPEQDKHYEALESHMVDGHPYHPSYKSRIGFSLKDNFAYGPEFNQEVAVYWVAVNKQLAATSISQEMLMNELLDAHLSKEDKQQFSDVLKEKGCSDKEYVLMPVHPWQLEHKIQSLFMQQVIEKDIVLLGTSCSLYRPQQSIRSVSHRSNTEAPYIKFPLSITNTSTSRILAQHTTQNAPLISDWLHSIIENDPLLQKEKFAILREVMGLSFQYDKLSAIQYGRTYGTLGAIFRENVSTYLEKNEQAWPLNAVTHVQKNGQSFVQSAIDQHGVEAWSNALINVVITPIIHLLYAHGIALESHAQNIILVVENNLPKRIIVKDLHDGVRYTADHLLHPEWAPALHPEPESHRKFNRYSFIQAESASDVRDYTYDAFFFICMTEISFTLEQFGLSEEDFWAKCAKTITDYQQQYPEYKERFAAFDLFSEDALIEEMTKRRIFGDGDLFFRKVKNPLRESLR